MVQGSFDLLAQVIGWTGLQQVLVGFVLASSVSQWLQRFAQNLTCRKLIQKPRRYFLQRTACIKGDGSGIFQSCFFVILTSSE
jgi:hypothetical protein